MMKTREKFRRPRITVQIIRLVRYHRQKLIDFRPGSVPFIKIHGCNALPQVRLMQGGGTGLRGKRSDPCRVSRGYLSALPSQIFYLPRGVRILGPPRRSRCNFRNCALLLCLCARACTFRRGRLIGRYPEIRQKT